MRHYNEQEARLDVDRTRKTSRSNIRFDLIQTPTSFFIPARSFIGMRRDRGEE